MREADQYLDIMIREATVARDLHARMLLAVHYRIRAGDDLSVSWPDWKDLQGEFGYLFRVFGSEAALFNFIQVINPLGTAGLVRIFRPLPIPGEIRQWAAFLRDRSLDKYSPSTAERLKRRAAVRGRTWTPSEERPTQSKHYLVVPSTSGQRNFSLYISRTTQIVGDSVGGGNYGLGRWLPVF